MNTRKTVLALFLIPTLMFGFGYLLVPIYDIFCELTGLNGKTGSISAAQANRLQADQSRIVRVEFMANLNENTPLDFAPAVRSMEAHPGKRYQATYSARNQLDQAMVGQAVPSVSPAQASSYFDKIECFCFGRQEFAAGERRDLPLIFVIDPDLPKDIDTITLSYTFFQVDGGAPASDHAQSSETATHGSEHGQDHGQNHAAAQPNQT